MARKWRYFRNQDCDESVPQSGCLRGPKIRLGWQTLRVRTQEIRAIIFCAKVCTL